MPFMMNDFYAAENAQQANQIQRQRIAENERNALEAKRVLEENAKARDIQTQAYNAPQAYKTLDIPDATPAAAPQGMVPTQQLVPQAGLTGLGGMSTPQQAPAGMQPTENLGGMQQPAAPVGIAQSATPTGVQQTTEAAPVTLTAKTQASAKTVQVAESEVQKVQRVADELHKAGLHDQANAYLEKQAGIIKNVEAAKDAHLKDTVAMSERAASLGNGYLEAIKAGGDPNAAWAELLIKASADGYPIESLLTVVDPKERIAKATEIINNAETTKQRAQMEREVYKETGRNRRSEDKAKLSVYLSNQTTTRQALNREAFQNRWKEGQDFQKYKASLSNFETNVKNAQNQRDDYDGQIAAIDLKIADIDNFRNLSIPEEADRTAAKDALMVQRNALSTARSAAEKDLNEQTTALKELQSAGKLFDKKDTTSAPARPKLDTTKYNYTKEVDPATREGYKKVMEHAKSLLKTDPQEAERIQREAQKRMLDKGYLIKAS